LLKAKRQGAKLDAEFAASKERPLVNLVLVVDNWGTSDAALKINGKKVARGKEFRFGIEYDVEGNTKLIVWLKIKAKEKTKISLTPVK
jgi:mRNA-degrading endonuclease RelE of RelBE toxin-antitoxin system